MNALDESVGRGDRLLGQLQDDELVAADARDHIRALKAAAQSLGNALQQRIADRRPERSR